ncbi:MAG: phosphoribosyl-ATP diphosphatase [Woeseiaceae bacterium]
MSTEDLAFIEQLEKIVQDRLQGPTEQSYTAQLATAGVERIAQKIGEEGVELALAAVSGKREQIIDEASDLVFHLIVLLANQQLTLSDIAMRLKSRHYD